MLLMSSRELVIKDCFLGKGKVIDKYSGLIYLKVVNYRRERERKIRA